MLMLVQELQGSARFAIKKNQVLNPAGKNLGW